MFKNKKKKKNQIHEFYLKELSIKEKANMRIKNKENTTI